MGVLIPFAKASSAPQNSPAAFLRGIDMAELFDPTKPRQLPKDARELRGELEKRGLRYKCQVEGPPAIGWQALASHAHIYGLEFRANCEGRHELEIIVHKYGSGYSVNADAMYDFWRSFTRHAPVDTRAEVIATIKRFLEEYKSSLSLITLSE